MAKRTDLKPLIAALARDEPLKTAVGAAEVTEVLARLGRRWRGMQIESFEEFLAIRRLAGQRRR